MSTSESTPEATRRLFHEDPYMRGFDARVLECIPADGGFDVVLDRTAFYATSGGQPHDVGTLGGQPVRDVVDEDGVLRHRVSGRLDGAVSGEIEWSRRFDHMQQHTGQHILSQAFIQAAGAETVSFHLGVDRVTIDVSRGDLDDGEVLASESLANRIIQSDLLVRTHWTTLADIGQFPLRKPPKVEGSIRIIEVDGFDFSACGGTHVRRTGEIGIIKVLRRERYKGGVRIEFICGGRAVRDYQAKHDVLRRIAERSSIQDKDVGELFDRMDDELAAARKRLRELEEIRLGVEADRLHLLAEAHGAFRVVKQVIPGGTPEELKFLALKLKARPGTVALLAGRGSDGRGHLAFARSDDVPVDAAVLIRVALPAIEGRGGGRAEMAQGSGPEAGRLEAALEAASKALADPAAGLA